MFKKKPMRIAAFIGTLGASATLIGMAATNTGAYFTDSASGHLNASNGHVKVNSSNLELSFANLMPGQYQDQPVSYNTQGASDNEDIWLVFDKNNATYQAITGDDGLGGYGHFAVADSTGATRFSSWNLHNDPATHDSGCANADGTGGNGRNSDYTYNHSPAGPNDTYCGIPGAIKIESGVPANNNRQFTITYGITPRATNVFQGANGSLPFKVVATQPGIRPDALWSNN